MGRLWACGGVLFLLLFQNLFVELSFNGFFGPGLQFFKFCVRECGSVSVFGKNGSNFIRYLYPFFRRIACILPMPFKHLRGNSKPHFFQILNDGQTPLCVFYCVRVLLLKFF